MSQRDLCSDTLSSLFLSSEEIHLTETILDHSPAAVSIGFGQRQSFSIVSEAFTGVKGLLRGLPQGKLFNPFRSCAAIISVGTQMCLFYYDLQEIVP